MSKVLISVGPIPAKLDSVKYISNRFKGGLALKTAEQLKNKGHEITLVAWKHSNPKTDLPIIKVDDVYDYFDKIINFKADAYILAAAVANLGPEKPFEGKFPSHNYKEGDVFPINFTIMPRTIDAIKQKYPTATLIGYKLFDGTEEELIKAARKTLSESKANLIFANRPETARDKKLVVTSDGAVFSTTFDEHVDLIDRLLKSKFYRTETINETVQIEDKDKTIIDHYPKHREAELTFGTFAVRKDGSSFVTTTRGKRAGEKAIAFVRNVDHKNRIVYADKKATLNAPLLHALLEKNPQINYLVHGHELIGEKLQKEYQFPGTDGDLKNVTKTKEKFFLIQLPHHGYIAGFTDIDECEEFLEKHANVE